MSRRRWANWGDAFDHYVDQGIDRSFAIWQTDQYMKYRDQLERREQEALEAGKNRTPE